MFLELLEHQKVGRDFLIGQRQAFLLDDRGLGKTIQAIAAVQKLGGKTLVLCESNKVLDWVAEFKLWAPEVKRFTALGDKDQRTSAYCSFFGSDAPAVLITNHHKLLRDIDFFLESCYDSVIIDEAEVFNSASTQLHNSLRWVCKTRKHIILLAAFPFGIDLSQFYNLFEVVGLGSIFASSQLEFREKFCIVVEKKFRVKGSRWMTKKVIVGAKNVEQFKELARPYCLRRTRKTTGIILPPVSFSAISCERSPRQVELYAAALKNQLETVGRCESFNPISKYQFLTQICDSPHLLDSKDSRVAPKIDELVKLLHRIEEKTVVFSQFLKWQPELVSRLQDEGFRIIQYYGTGLSPVEKANRDQQFRESTDPVIFLCTEAAKRGINLQHCHNMVVLDFPFNPIDMLQLFGRVDRIGQKSNVAIYYLVMDGTHEEKIFRVLHGRQTLIDQVLDSNQSACFDLEELFKETLSGL